MHTRTSKNTSTTFSPPAAVEVSERYKIFWNIIFNILVISEAIQFLWLLEERDIFLGSKRPIYTLFVCLSVEYDNYLVDCLALVGALVSAFISKYSN